MKKCLVCGKPALPNSSFCDVLHATQWRIENMRNCHFCSKPVAISKAYKFPILVMRDGRVYERDLLFCNKDCRICGTADLVAGN